jgi:cytochrome b561
MPICDTKTGYGLLTRLLHWIMALGIVALFALGLWMVTLSYVSPYYTIAPDIHRSVGMLLLFLLVLRFGWRLANPKPALSELSPLERRLAPIVHWGFYPLLFALMASGYLISTADGRPIEVFDWFSVPALVRRKGLEDTAGDIHEILAWVTIGLVVLHAAASLKHHFVDRNTVLKRMWSGPPSAP